MPPVAVDPTPTPDPPTPPKPEAPLRAHSWASFPENAWVRMRHVVGETEKLVDTVYVLKADDQMLFSIETKGEAILGEMELPAELPIGTVSGEEVLVINGDDVSCIIVDHETGNGLMRLWLAPESPLGLLAPVKMQSPGVSYMAVEISSAIQTVGDQDIYCIVLKSEGTMGPKAVTSEVWYSKDVPGMEVRRIETTDDRVSKVELVAFGKDASDKPQFMVKEPDPPEPPPPEPPMPVGLTVEELLSKGRDLAVDGSKRFTGLMKKRIKLPRDTAGLQALKDEVQETRGILMEAKVVYTTALSQGGSPASIKGRITRIEKLLGHLIKYDDAIDSRLK